MSTTPFGTHFEEAVAKAAAGNIDAKPLEFFLPTTPAIENRLGAIRMTIHAKRMEEVESWIRRELVPHLGADVCALPSDEFAAAVRDAGIYGKEVSFPHDDPGVMRFVLYGRTMHFDAVTKERIAGPDDVLATMTFEPTFGVDKANRGE